MATRFYHPIRGYWETITDVEISERPDFPEGTVEVTQRPDTEYDWNGSQWAVNQQRRDEKQQRQQQENNRRNRVSTNRGQIAQRLGLTVEELEEALGLGEINA